MFIVQLPSNRFVWVALALQGNNSRSNLIGGFELLELADRPTDLMLAFESSGPADRNRNTLAVAEYFHDNTFDERTKDRLTIDPRR